MTAIPDPQASEPAEDIERVNAVLSEWAARSAADSATLIDRFEDLGYAVRGKSEEEIAEILRKPPTEKRRT